MPDETRVRGNAEEVKDVKEPAVLDVRIKFNGPVNDDGLNHFTQLLDRELEHVHDEENQRVVPKNGKLVGGWGYGRAMVLDVERIDS